MFQTFYTDTIESRFIKALLKNTPLPLINTVSINDYVIEGCFYIYKTQILKCLKSGFLTKIDKVELTVAENLFVSNKLYLDSGFRSAECISIKPYIFGRHYNQITESFVSNQSHYDTATHHYLGKYLKCYRDIYGVDLMPFYNCYNHKFITDIYLDRDAPNGYVEALNTDYKLVAVPIRFNKTYTVAVDCNSKVLIKSMLYGKLGVLKTTIDYEKINLVDMLTEPVTMLPSTNFVQPFTYTISCEDKFINSFEQYLYMLIQLPRKNNSSILVFEGDYTFRGNKSIINIEGIDNVLEATLNKTLLSKLSLAQFSDKVNYAFSDRLIEHLLYNVVDATDDITDNVALYQTYSNYSSERSMKGVWDSRFRAHLFNAYMSTNNKKLDITGHIDKDVERFVLNRRAR